MLVTEWATSRPPNPIFAVSGCRVPSTGHFPPGAGLLSWLGVVGPIARTIATAVRASKPKRRYTAGTGARLGGILAAMPIGVRERAITAFLGLGKIKAGQ